MPLRQASRTKGEKSKPDRINRLPSELLLEIFSIYVWTRYGSPTNLILVCKLWESLASYPELWGNIYYGYYDLNAWYSIEEEHVSRRMEEEGFIRCRSQESLNRAIEKTKSSTFELRVCRHPNEVSPLEVDNLDKEAISQRCRLIRLIGGEGYLDFIPILTKVPLLSLKEFICPNRWWSVNTNASLVTENLSENSPVLWNMSTSLFESSPAFRSLLPRLKKFHTSNINNIHYYDKDKLGVLEMLEEIKIEDDTFEVILDQAQEPSPMPLLKRVSMEDKSLYYLPIQLYAQLTHLTLDCCDSTSAFEGLISLPLLSYLCVEGSWEYVHHLEASNLITLSLRCGGVPYDLVERADAKSLENVSIIPKILYIDRTIPEEDILAFLSKNGQKLEELSITYVKPNDMIGEQVSTALGDGERKKTLCPLLRRLDIITILFDEEELYRATKRRLQQIVDGRASGGTLTKVRHGIYPITSEKKMLYVLQRRYWAFKWIQVL